MNLFSIGFTKKSAESFFLLLEDNRVNLLIDIRLNNKSQLAGFTKFPDIKYFLSRISNINYIHDILLAPTEEILKDYKNNKSSWKDYKIRFSMLMNSRDIKKHIEVNYSLYNNKNICLLCSEEKAEECHRSLVAEYFKEVFGCSIKNL